MEKALLVVLFSVALASSAFAFVNVSNYGCSVNGSTSPIVSVNEGHPVTVAPQYYDEIINIAYAYLDLSNNWHYYTSDELVVWPASVSFNLPINSSGVQVICHETPINIVVNQDTHAIATVISNDFDDYSCSEWSTNDWFDEDTGEWHSDTYCSGIEAWIDRNYTLGGSAQQGESIHIEVVPNTGFKVDSVALNGEVVNSTSFNHIVPPGMPALTISFTVSPILTSVDTTPLVEAVLYRCTAIAGMVSSLIFAFVWKG